jgi:hypothetical protein
MVVAGNLDAVSCAAERRRMHREEPIGIGVSHENLNVTMLGE